MSKSYCPEASFSRATSQAWRPLAAVSSRSVDSQVKPSPRVCHSTPRWSASLRSPVRHFPPLTNCTTPTRHPRAHPRPMTPKAADDLPLPWPVLTSTIESARAIDDTVGSPAAAQGTRWESGAVPQLSPGSAPPPAPVPGARPRPTRAGRPGRRADPGARRPACPGRLGGRVDVQLQTRTRREQGRDLPVLVWRLAPPARVIASAPHGGGLGVRRWILNAQVPASY